MLRTVYMTWWLLLSLVSPTASLCQDPSNYPSIQENTDCLGYVISQISSGDGINKPLQDLEKALEATVTNTTVKIIVNGGVALVHPPQQPFEGVEIYATENEAVLGPTLSINTVSVQLPAELHPEAKNTIVFSFLTSLGQNTANLGILSGLYEDRLIGVSVRSMNFLGLQERINITMNLSTGVEETKIPLCVFLNFTANATSSDGCLTLWERGQAYVTCSCDHLTYFGVLMVTPSLPLSDRDEDILTYISLAGCCVSLFALICAVVLFITNKKLRKDVSMKIHINLAIALMLLNLHFLPSQAVAALPYTGLCIYVALCLHYFLLAALSWMALEGFHVYLLFIKVFNIYIRRYHLKLSVVGWGIPAVIVSLVFIIDKDAYGTVSVDPLDTNSTTICYIANDTVKVVTTLGIFGLMFIFNVSLLGVTTKNVMCLHSERERQKDCEKVKKDICTLWGIITLLGITWGLVFFSFGHLTTPGLYLFCILNSLQGFFIFLWFLMSLRKNKGSTSATSSDMQSNNS